MRWAVRLLVLSVLSALAYLIWLYVDDALHGDPYA